MHDYFLKYETETEMVSDFKTRFTFDEESKTFHADGVQIDIVGIIFRLLNDETSVPLQGWHVNIRSDNEMVFDNVVTPTTPVRVWV